MVTTLVRFNQVQPGLEPGAMADRYQASLDMAAYADTHGFALVTLEEHHGADDGWSPSPLVSAGLVFGRCPRIHVVIMALLLPLHDPVRLAEDIAVLDLASGGRLSIVGGLGYRPQEYELLGKSWADHGRAHGRGRRHPVEGVDRRAVRVPGCHGSRHTDSLHPAAPEPFHRGYIETVGPACGPIRASAGHCGLPPRTGGLLLRAVPGGRNRGILLHASGKFSTTYVAEDPDRAWAEVGQYMLHEATVYANWQTPDIHSAVHSHAQSTDELRAEGIYEILTPDECVARADEAGAATTFALHPLVGGMPIDKGWECLTLYVEKVLPRLQA